MTAFDASLDPQRTEAILSDGERAVRDVFVGEYMKDLDPFRACIRMGFLSAFAIELAKTFMGDGYVLRQIAYLNRKSIEPSEDDKAEMLANLRQLALTSHSDSVRATASKQYMEAQGYIAKDAGEEGATKLVNALEKFARNAPS